MFHVKQTGQNIAFCPVILLWWIELLYDPHLNALPVGEVGLCLPHD
jgi:hypothetical protein